MKTIPLLFLVIFLGKGCNSDLKKESENISFEYETLTRGSYNKIIVKQDTIFTIHDASMGEVTKAEISKKDWKELLNMLGKVEMNSIEKMKAPTNDRAHDGALHANLKVVYKDKTYQSDSFDAGNPPKEIEKIVNKVITVSNKK